MEITVVGEASLHITHPPLLGQCVHCLGYSSPGQCTLLALTPFLFKQMHSLEKLWVIFELITSLLLHFSDGYDTYSSPGE